MGHYGSEDINMTYAEVKKNAVGLAEGWIEGTESEVIEAWQYLLDTGLCWKLQGWFGRTAKALINEGIIKEVTING